MGRTDSQRHFHTHSALTAEFAALPTPGDGEMRTATHLPVEGAEGLLPGWEAAWIDLGGEG